MDDGDGAAGSAAVYDYLDDIIVSARTEVEHLHNLEMMLRPLEAAGFCFKHQKCVFLPQVEYLGHQIFAAGLQH